MSKRLLILVTFVALAAMLMPMPVAAFNGMPKTVPARSKTFSAAEMEVMARTTAEIKTGFGVIKIRFFPEVAPNHVNNFIELAKAGFYNGTTFHRVIPGFMIQGGDPNTKSPNRAMHGFGGPGYYLKAEFNNKPHRRGILSMARGGNPDSAGSQFFICVKAYPSLDGQYTVFGEVLSGMGVADKIVMQPRDARDNPLERVEITVKIIEPELEEKKEADAKPEEKKESAPDASAQ